MLPLGGVNCMTQFNTPTQSLDLTDDAMTPEDEATRDFKVRLKSDGTPIPLSILQTRMFIKAVRPGGSIAGAFSVAICTADQPGCSPAP
jgi:hypothetical protein